MNETGTTPRERARRRLLDTMLAEALRPTVQRTRLAQRAPTTKDPRSQTRALYAAGVLLGIGTVLALPFVRPPATVPATQGAQDPPAAREPQQPVDPRAMLDRLPAEQEAAPHLPLTMLAGRASPLRFPGEGPPRGLTRAGDALWLARGEELLQLGWPDLTVKRRVPVPGDVRDLAADDRFVYALRERDIAVLDPNAGREMRTIALELPPTDGAAAHGITCHRGDCFVLLDRQLCQIDLRTGKSTPLHPVPGTMRLQWLTHDGEQLLLGTERSVIAFDRTGQRTEERGRWVHRGDATAVAHSAGAWSDDALIVFGSHADAAIAAALRMQPWPSGQWLLQVSVFARQDGAPRWQVGPRPIHDERKFAKELERLQQHFAVEPGTPVPIVIAVHVGAMWGDVAKTWDLVKAAGFTIVLCPGLESVAPPTPSTQPK